MDKSIEQFDKYIELKDVIVKSNADRLVSLTVLQTFMAAMGALMVLDCIASGCAWVDMEATGVDVLISAPQKGWSASPSASPLPRTSRC